MRILSKSTAALLLLSTLPAFAATHPRHSRSTSATVRHTAASTRRPVAAHPVVTMPSERATAIQQALIQRGYLSGEPTGVWDSQSAEAMKKLQGENGWQTKWTPDSRALIKLGLGGSGTSTVAANIGGEAQ